MVPCLPARNGSPDGAGVAAALAGAAPNYTDGAAGSA